MKKRRRSLGTVSVDVDLDDVIYNLDNDDIREIAESAGIVVSKQDGDERSPEDREIVSDAIAKIRAGRINDAIVTLERAFLPRWRDVAACEARYREMMVSQQ